MGIIERRVDIYNLYSGSTALLQYIGVPFDTVEMFASIFLEIEQAQIFADLNIGVIGSVGIDQINNQIIGENFVDTIKVTTTHMLEANANGVGNVILFTGGLSAGVLVQAEARLIGAT